MSGTCHRSIPIIEYHMVKRKARGVPVEKKKMGRPTDNPRPNKLSIRISDEDKQILEEYCQKENVNRTEAISRGIKKLRSVL